MNLAVNWNDVFTPDVSILESFIRGTVIYFAVFIIMRSTLRRTAGELTMLDFIFVLLVASGAADAMVGGSISAINGIVLILTIVAWNYALNTLSWYFPIIERWTVPPPLQIVRKGRLVRRNMRKEFLTEAELMSKLREDGIESVSDVKAAFIEGDGNISIIAYDENGR
jgi:uncharacterized membrane protein YcaP (DUF421 family)